jgi:hypothetical protein
LSSNQERTTVLEDVVENESDLGTLLSGEIIEEVTATTLEGEDYDILIQGSDRRYPAIIIRRKHRGKGATIKTISKNGKHAEEYAEYAGIIEAYQVRRAGSTSGGHAENRPEDARESWIDQTIQSVVGRPDNSENDPD